MTLAVTPLVSVVIPTHNRSALVARAVRCCLDQVAIPSIEVIVVDDFSHDDTSDVVAAIGDDRVRYLRLPKNLGGAAARNAGISLTTGRYLALLDSDDTWSLTKLKRQVEAMEASPQIESLVLHTQIRAHSEGRTEILPERAKGEGESIADYLFVGDGHLQTSSLFLTTQLAKRTGFDPNLRKHQDYDFCLRLEDQGASFQLIEEPLVDWFHDDRADRITLRYGMDASQCFFVGRRDRLGAAAASAFWVKMLFLRQLKVQPITAIRGFVGTMMGGTLPLSWYINWLVRGVKKQFSR